jgi:hypothetical protein
MNADGKILVVNPDIPGYEDWPEDQPLPLGATLRIECEEMDRAEYDRRTRGTR